MLLFFRKETLTSFTWSKFKLDGSKKLCENVCSKNAYGIIKDAGSRITLQETVIKLSVEFFFLPFSFGEEEGKKKE